MRLVREGRLQEFEDTPPSSGKLLMASVVGGTGLVLGLLTIALMIYSLLAPH